VLHEAPTSRDQFQGRLLTAAGLGVALLAAGYGCYFAFQRGPMLRGMLEDFGMQIPGPSAVALALPWIPLVIALLAALAGALAWHSPQRWRLVCAYVLTFLALAATIAFDIAARWPTERLFRSVIAP
jgi:hypothetical protein